MLFLPPEGGNRAVQNLNRPPFGHNRDGTSAAMNADRLAVFTGRVVAVWTG